MTKADTSLVLIVDDHPNMVRLLQKILRHDARLLTANSGREAVRLLEQHDVSVVLADLKMPGMDGIAVLGESKRLRPNAEFILMTAYATVATAVEALRLGAYDYLTKPFEPEAARAIVLRALGRAAVEPEAAAVGGTPEVLPGFLGQSASIRAVGDMVRRFAASDATILLLGETGTGKERVARAVHQLSARASQRFVAVNCAAIPTELLESELFGHARGAFTGAARERAGLFEEANDGTLFFDEIGELRTSFQAKLTRALEERSIRRLAESKERRVNVRLVAATHRDLESMVASGSFREDLWYRLNVAVVRIPPLRERREDIELLATHFLRECAEAGPERGSTGFTPAALETALRYDWPGNVRQLRAAVERAYLMRTQARLDADDWPPEVIGARSGSSANLAALPWNEAQELAQTDAARHYLEEVLKRHGGRVAEAAAHAKVERESFYRLMRRYNVRTDEQDQSKGDQGDD